MSQKRSHNQFVAQMATINPNIKILGIYQSNSISIEVICNVCGYSWFVRPGNLINGGGCPKCRGLYRTQEEFEKQVFDLVNSEYIILGLYTKVDTKIKFKHTKCGTEFDMQPSAFLHGNRCPHCKIINMRKPKEDFLKKVYEMYGDEYVVIGEYVDTRTKIKILHTKCGNVNEVVPHSFVYNHKCPYCCNSPQKVAAGFNSMWDTNPELAKLLLNPDDGYKYTKCSNKHVDWKCSKCGQVIKNRFILDVYRRGLSCSQCGDGISYPNKLMCSVLSYLNVDFESEKYFKWCKFTIGNKNTSGRYDFYFVYNNKEYVVEMDGGFHFIDNKMNGQTKEESHEIDIIKDNLAILHNILPIRIDSQKSELEYIKDNILKSDLNDVLDLSSIDWQECERRASSSLKIQISDLWKIHHDTKIISNIMKRDRGTIIRWLKACTLMGMSEYTSSRSRKVFCVDTNETFNSTTAARKKYHGDILSCCQGKQDYAGKLPDGTKLHWRYAN